MKPIPLIRASVALHLSDFLASCGAPAERLWAASGLPVRWDREPERLVPLEFVLRLFEDAARQQGMDDLGLRAARRTGLAAAGQFGARLLVAPTLHGAVAFACAHVAAHNSGARYWLVPEGDSVRLCRRFRCAGSGFRQSDLFSVVLMIQLVRRVAGPDWLPSRVELQSTDPLQVVPPATLTSLSSGSLEVGRAMTSIRFPRSFLARPLAAERRPDAASGAWLEHGPPADFLASLDLVIASNLDAARGDLAVAAEAAGLSVRSFQRRLTELGVTYSQLVDRVRLHKAIEWLQDAGVKIIDVAFALGYSDPAHFTRAFRRWTSLTPAEYRHLQLAGGEGAQPAAKRPAARGPSWRCGWDGQHRAPGGGDMGGVRPARTESPQAISLARARQRRGAVDPIPRERA